ncbi:MAG: creatininase family protein [Acidobacteria bacterium]|jgi:creatinine amidohydrolase|nr:creatininase family protein [Acidobacteriota bacterium]
MAENVLMNEMSWTEVEEALKERPIALLPVGTTEAHGPHLPVTTDAIIAVELARRGVKKLEERGLHALIMPPVTFSVSELAAEFPGTLSLPEETVVALVRDLGVALSKAFRAVAIVNVNQEKAHIEALKKAVAEANEAGASVRLTDFAKKRWVDQLGEAFAAGDHGGSFQTSLMMAAAPDHVRERERISLPPMDGLAAALEKGAKTFAEAGGEDAYFGDPTAANAEQGEAAFEALSGILGLDVAEYVGSKA